MATQTLRSGMFLRPESVLRSVGIQEEQKIAHFGCGPGFFVIPAAELVGNSGQVVGVDIRTQAVEETSRRASVKHLDNVDVFRSDIAEPRGSKLPDAWADFVILTNILHQSDIQAVLLEAARVVRPETGRILAIEWEVTHIPIGPPVDQRVEQDVLIHAAQSVNLSVVRRWKPSPYHYALLLGRATS